MSYERQNFVNGQVLTAENLNRMDEALATLSAGQGGGGAGEAGGYYTPSVSSAGVLSWTASKSGMPSVQSSNIKGADGVTPSLSIGTVTTLSAGSSATASITGTTANPVLNLGIPKGKDGTSGTGGGGTGADGVGIASVVQTTTSSADGGSNVITVTLTDGTSSTFTVKNGSKGSTGADGYSIYYMFEEVEPGYDFYNIQSSNVSTNGRTIQAGDFLISQNGVICTVSSVSGSSINYTPRVYTKPVRGTDYWTASDIAEIKSYVDDAILGGAW